MRLQNVEPYPFQQQGIDYLGAHPRALLADDPGLGKTLQALAVAESPCLIVAAATIHAAGVWQDEIARCRPDLEYVTSSYERIPDNQRTEKGGYATLPRPREEYRRDWGTVIVDECHHVVGRQATRTKALEKVVARTPRLIMLSGTAIPNWAHELYVPVKWLHESGDRRWSSYWRWVEEWFQVDAQPWYGAHAKTVGDLLPTRTWEEFQQHNLEGVFLRRERDDVLRDLPPLTEQHFDVSATPHQRRVYKELRKDFLAWTDSGVEIAAWSKAAQVTKLAKVATGIELLDPSTRNGSGKLDLLAELLDARRHTSTIVFCWFRTAAAACARVCEDLGLGVELITGAQSATQRGDTARRFQEGEFPVLIGTLSTLSEGLTLTRADGAIFVEHAWTPRPNVQAQQRCHRIGQTRPVWVAHLWTKGTVDVRMRELLATKSDQQMRALPVTALRELV